MDKQKTDQVFKVPHTTEGLLFLELANKYLNKESYQLKRRGRTPDAKSLKKAGLKPSHFRQSLPLPYAKNIGVYLLAKIKSDGHKITRTIGARSEQYRKDHINHLYDEDSKNRNKLYKIQSILREV